LAKPAQQAWENPSLHPGRQEYASKALRLFVEGLGVEGKGQILDVGSVCGDNINFFARLIKRLYVCDIFFHLVQGVGKVDSSHRVWEHLDYPPGSFEGILLWDLIDRLEDRDAREVVRRCYSMTKRGGMVMMLATGQQAFSKVLNSFVVIDGFRVYLRPREGPQLALYVRQNREVLEMLAPFDLITSFIYRDGTREFLFRRP
jgi:2-polyprenyl-3-methyl-5-hydroxy-6-metoxy-1,4-benzoquinol methylase